MDDVLYTRDGRRVGRLDPVFKDRVAIREAQVIQDALDVVRVRYVPADGCSDARELGTNHVAGGDRDPSNPWDFFDVPTPVLLPSVTSGTRNHSISIQDTIAVLAYIGTSAGSPTHANANGAKYGTDLNGNGINDGYEYDRTPSTVAGKPWRTGAPDGVVSIADALVSLSSIGDACAP